MAAEFFSSVGGISPAKSNISTKRAYLFVSLASVYNVCRTFDVADRNSVFLVGEIRNDMTVSISPDSEEDGAINSTIVTSYKLEAEAHIINKVGADWTLEKLQDLMNNDLTFYIVEVVEALALTNFISNVLVTGFRNLYDIEDFCRAKYVLHSVSAKATVTSESSAVREIKLEIIKSGMTHMEDGVYENVPFGVAPDQYNFATSSDIADGQGYRATDLTAGANTTFDTDHYESSGADYKLETASTGTYYHGVEFSKYVYFEMSVTIGSLSSDRYLFEHGDANVDGGVELYFNTSGYLICYINFGGTKYGLVSQQSSGQNWSSTVLNNVDTFSVSVFFDLRKGRGFIYVDIENSRTNILVLPINTSFTPTDAEETVFLTNTLETKDLNGDVHKIAFGFI